MRIQIITLFIAVMTTGLLSGIFFTWTNAVTPGIGKLNDLGYLTALQSMNRVILNPSFYIIFMGSVVILPLSTVLNYETKPSFVFKIMLVASIIYILGVFLVTILGNIPLNDLLDKIDLEDCSIEDVSNLRDKIEAKWNGFNLIRTIASTSSFILLIVVCFLVNK